MKYIKLSQVVAGVLLMGLGFSVPACSQKNGFVLRGKIQGAENKQLVLYSRSANQKTNKPVMVHADGSFEVRDTVKGAQPLLYELSDPTIVTMIKNGMMVGGGVSFFAQNGEEIQFHGSSDSYFFSTVSGNKLSEELNQLNQQLQTPAKAEQKIWDQVTALRKERNPEKNAAAIDSLQNLTDPFQDDKKKIYLDFARSHANDLAGAYATEQYTRYTNDEAALRVLYNALGPAAKQADFLDIVAKKLGLSTVETSLGVGQPAPDFRKVDKDGKTFSLSDYKGKYVLLDFWGSWCGPCRASNPHLKKTFEKYQNDGLVVIGIAKEHGMDSTAWLKAIKHDALPWRQVLNDNGKDSVDVVKLFSISGYPTKILIGPDGNVLIRYVGGPSGATAHIDEEDTTSQLPDMPDEKSPIDAKLQSIFNK